MLNKWLEKLNRQDYPFIDVFYYVGIVVLILIVLLITKLFF
jgi:hypothetical protein